MPASASPSFPASSRHYWRLGIKGAIRPLALGRKNWLHVGSPDSGPKVAAIASIVETCRRLDINLRALLDDIHWNGASKSSFQNGSNGSHNESS